jgi:hypothetical protein
MNAEQPAGAEAASVPPKTSDLTGLTVAIGLDTRAVGQIGDPLLGADIGGIRIESEIAEGGMGRVYKGLQDKPRRPVAVKIVRPGLLSQEASRRFDNESELLGRLRHPYIAQVYSAGISAVFSAQVPYFVMEFIHDALPVTRYAAEHKLSTRERVELFRKVCEAVAHGHENNVIHRDLKPSNILVDSNGVPKVIDFGVARCVDATAEPLTNVTDVGQLIGTVQYMSPEQFMADPTNVDARADVYALGVILYELLAGKPPYEIRKLSIRDAEQLVRECRVVSPRVANREVSRDLAHITATCLQKDRQRRYASAAELQQVLTAYAKGRPIARGSRGPLGRLSDWVQSWVPERAQDWLYDRPRAAAAWLAVPAVVLGAAVLAWFSGLEMPRWSGASETRRPFEFNGHSYRIFLEPATWAEAAKRCEEVGGSLARVETAAENRAIVAAIQARDIGPACLWINGVQAGPEQAWSYGDNTPVRFFARNPVDIAGADAESRSLAIAVVPPVSYWAAVDGRTTAKGFICEWTDNAVEGAGATR